MGRNARTGRTLGFRKLSLTDRRARNAGVTVGSAVIRGGSSRFAYAVEPMLAPARNRSDLRVRTENCGLLQTCGDEHA